MSDVYDGLYDYDDGSDDGCDGPEPEFYCPKCNTRMPDDIYCMDCETCGHTEYPDLDKSNTDFQF